MYTKHMIISSSSNPKVQRLQKLMQKKKARQTECVFVAEGVRLLEESIKWGKKPREFYWGGELSTRGEELAQMLIGRADASYELSDQLVRKISDTGNSQGVFGVFDITYDLPEKIRFILIADEIRDPGNMGTLMRSAKAMGVDGIITTSNTVDAYSPKVVRSAMGVHFALPVVDLSWEALNSRYPKKSNGMTFWTTVVDGGISIHVAEPKYPLALVVGGEANGVSSDALLRSDLGVTIPMKGNTESLNAGVAGSIALYEIMRKQLT